MTFKTQSPKQLLGYALVLSMLFFYSCKQDNLQSIEIDPSSFTSFDEYINYIDEVTYDDYNSKKNSTANRLEFSKMKDHILDMYDGVQVNHSFEMEDGRNCDCIPVLQQASIRKTGKLEKTPDFIPSMSNTIKADPNFPADQIKPDIESKEESIALKEATHDRHGNLRQCEKETFPMIRLEIDRMATFESLDAFFHKCPNGDCNLLQEEKISRRYAYLNRNVNNRGGSSHLNIWKPTTPSGRNSISQQWYTSGSGGSTQTVEGGWKVTNNRNPDLFIYHTTAGYSPGSGCYNMDCAGFVQIDNHWTLGRSFNTLSQTNGSQYSFRMLWYKDGTNGSWWLWLAGYDKGAGRWIGYYPSSIYGTGTMATNATRVLFGGEVSYDETVSSASQQMGSGAQASAGWRRAAYQRDVAYYTTSNNLYRFSTSTEIETDPSCYTINRINTSSSAWGTYFYFGGNSCN